MAKSITKISPYLFFFYRYGEMLSLIYCQKFNHSSHVWTNYRIEHKVAHYHPNMAKN
jgi:hypothetical protein